MSQDQNHLEERYRARHFRKRTRLVIKKLRQILNSNQNLGVRWRSDGHGFTILDKNKFYYTTIPKKFKMDFKKVMDELIDNYSFKASKDEQPYLSFRSPLFSKNSPDQYIPDNKQRQRDKERVGYIFPQDYIPIKEKRQRKLNSNQSNSMDLSHQIQNSQMIGEDSQIINPDKHENQDIRLITITIQFIIKTEKNQQLKKKYQNALKKLKQTKDPKILKQIKQIDPQSQKKIKDIKITIKVYLNQFYHITKVQPKYQQFKIDDEKLIQILFQIQQHIDSKNFKTSYFQVLESKRKDIGWTQQFIQDWMKAVQQSKSYQEKESYQEFAQNQQNPKNDQQCQIAYQNQVKNYQQKEPQNILSHIILNDQKKQVNSNQMQEQNIQEQKYKSLNSQIVRLNQEYERICAQTFFYKKIRSDPDLKPENVIFSNDQSTYFRSIFFKKLHEHKMTKLGKLIHKMKTPKVKRRKLPFTMYINEQRELQKAEKIKFQNVSEDMQITQNKINFSDGALHLIHDNHPVDIDEFFRYDWSKFEVMSFNNCGLTSADWVKISRNALEMLPRLKLLELNDNKIHMVRKNDFMKFVEIKKIELNRNKLDGVCEDEIQKYKLEEKDLTIEIQQF